MSPVYTQAVLVIQVIMVHSMNLLFDQLLLCAVNWTDSIQCFIYELYHQDKDQLPGRQEATGASFLPTLLTSSCAETEKREKLE